MNKKLQYLGILSAVLPFALMSPSVATASDWTWSEGLKTYYYRDNDGRVHYGDGSVSGKNTVWSDASGKTVYAANSAGPADTTGQYAYKAPVKDFSNIGAPPAPPVSTAYKPTGGPVFGPSGESEYKQPTATTTVAATSSKWTGTDSSVWKWSEALGAYSYRDNDGRVHYSDGSVGPATTAWSDASGKTVYAANSAGPADTTGQYAYKATAIDMSNIGPPPAAPTPVYKPSTGGPVFGPSGASEYKKPIAAATVAAVAASKWTGTDSSVWKWSESLGAYSYRDNDGRVHYSDGSVSGTNTVWSDATGKTVYAANSAGPADTTGQYAYKAAAIDTSNIGPPPAPPVTQTPVSTGGPVFGGTVANVSKNMPTLAQQVQLSSAYSNKIGSADGSFGFTKANSSGWGMQ